MFRQSLRTSVRLARGAVPSSTLVLGRQSRQFTKAVRPTLLQTATPWKALTQVGRMYSSEATADATADATAKAAEEVESESTSTSEITAFRDIASPINPNLLKAITRDMGYETMTPVQAKTINPALKGTDM